MQTKLKLIKVKLFMIPSHIVTINLEYALLRIYSRKFKKALYFMQFY